MKNKIIKSYIKAYKDNFTKISKQELYKWKAVKQFQGNWNIEATNFYEMLKISLKKVSNLMDSGSYFPKDMLLKNTEITPEKIRELFKELYNEEDSIPDRIENFRSQFKVLSEKNFKGDNPHQDHRAVVVYLALMYPERYYFYKFKMYKHFVADIENVYQPKSGKIENIFYFNRLCDGIKHLASTDQELLRLHNNRLTNDCYIDESLHILTQDIIYAVVQHLDVTPIETKEKPSEISIENTKSSEVDVQSSTVSFIPSITNHIQKNKEQKRIGDLGEMFVVKLEKEKLNKANKSKLAKKVAHHSLEKGDGLGYDVLSVDELDNEIFIEVKTTKGNANMPFYITKNELERSKKEQDNYFIYRVYNFNEDLLEGDVLVIQGDVSNLCVDAVNYKVKMK